MTAVCDARTEVGARELLQHCVRDRVNSRLRSRINSRLQSPMYWRFYSQVDRPIDSRLYITARVRDRVQKETAP